MNIYKTKYGLVKAKLKLYGKRMRQGSAKATDGAESMTKQSAPISNDEWGKIIAAYFAQGNTDEERELISWMFFRDCSVIEVCRKFYMSEKAYYVRRERILNDILFLATERGLITTGILGGEAMATTDRDSGIAESEWAEIERLVSESSETVFSRLTVEAILHITLNNLPWRSLPEKYGAWNTIYKRYSKWRKIGLWEKIREISNRFD